MAISESSGIFLLRNSSSRLNAFSRALFSRVDKQCGPREAENIHLWPFERVISAYHYNRNVETYYEVGNALGCAMVELLKLNK